MVKIFPVTTHCIARQDIFNLHVDGKLIEVFKVLNVYKVKYELYTFGSAESWLIYTGVLINSI